MVTRLKVRASSEEKFNKCVELRNFGLSYAEIMNEVPVAKSTLQNWLTLAGLTITKSHLEIQLKKRVENRPSGNIGLQAAKFKREDSYRKGLEEFLNLYLGNLDPLLVAGCMLYEAEGTKEDCRFSNSDVRVIQCFLCFIETYFDRDRVNGMSFRLYIHVNRSSDLNRIKSYWSENIRVPKDLIMVSWKKHLAQPRINKDYVGQMSVTVRRSTLIGRQIRALSGIILAT